jgi:adenylosuccinate synthase
MPVSVVVGGQFGSEGKGKVALEIVRRDASVRAVVRVGGTNSGHTGVTRDGRVIALRQLPAAAIDGNVDVVLPPGSYIEPELLFEEMELLKLDYRRLYISPFANVITREHKEWERGSALNESIGSTESGTGAAVLARIARNSRKVALPVISTEDVPALATFLKDTTELLRNYLAKRARIVIEGTQGFGLSLLHTEHWPKATSRDTTAGSCVAEAGVSPIDVDDITLVLRCHPIRVAGKSGPMVDEISWKQVANEAGLSEDLTELTTVTKLVRRVGRFDAQLVRQAIAVNNPTRLVLNHLDYIDPEVRRGKLTKKADNFIQSVRNAIGRPIDWVGIGRSELLEYAVSARV